MGFVKSKIKTVELPHEAELYRQTYDKNVMPEMVTVTKLGVFPDDQGGWFKESLRVDNDGNVLFLKESGIDFKIKQSNMSYLAPLGQRFWHIHPTQNEIWTTNSTLLLGLVDLRKDSKTYGDKSKIVLSPDRAVYIPHGVAHGLLNPSSSFVTLVYFTDQYFEATDNTEEYRIDPATMSFDFVKPEVM